MSVTAAQLGRTGVRSKEIETVVRDLIQTADVELNRFPKQWGRNVMSFDLPVNFNFSGLERKHAQRVVYVAVGRSLEERGFTVRMRIEETICTLFIEWVSDINEKEVAEMNQYLEQRQIVGSEVDEFLSPTPRHIRPQPPARDSRAPPNNRSRIRAAPHRGVRP